MIIIPITLITSIAYYQFYEKERSSLSRTQLNILNGTKEKLNYIFTVTNKLGQSIATNHRLKNYLASGGIQTYYSEKEYNSFISPLFEYSITRQMVKYHSTSIYIHDYSVKESGNTFIHDKELLSQKWYTDFLLSDKQTIWLPPYSKSNLIGPENERKKVYSYCKKLHSNSGDYLGLLVINIYEKNLYKGFSGLYQYPNEFNILDYSGNLIHKSNPESEAISNKNNQLQLTDSPYSYMSGDRYNTYTFIENMGFYIEISSPIYSQLFLSPQILLALIISGLLLIIIIFFFYRYVSNLFKIINDKILSVNNIIHNGFKEKLPIKRDDEIGEISRSFNILLDKINTLIKDVVAKETAQKDASLKALQYQINPHFIYNTIEIFSNKVELLGEYETSDALASFGKMLRYNLKNSSLYSTIEEEIQHVKSFVNIEKIKFGDNLTCNINYSKELNSVKIIKFILQPIVENCFTHGFDKSQPDMRIDINIIAQDHFISICVSDNGKGIDLEYCELLNEVFRTSNYQHPDLKTVESEEGIGLMNINERLKLFYNPKCHISISRLNGYTLVSFILPLLEK